MGIHADDAVASHKRSTILTRDERVASVIGCRFADEMVPNAPWRIDRGWLEKHSIDLVVHGDDYSEEQLQKTHAAPMEMGIFRTVPYPTLRESLPPRSFVVAKKLATFRHWFRIKGTQGQTQPQHIPSPITYFIPRYA